MKLIIDTEPGNLPAALALAQEEAARIDAYIRPGWGWAFGNYRDGPHFFVRRIQDGLSVREIRPPAKNNALGSAERSEPKAIQSKPNPNPNPPLRGER